MTSGAHVLPDAAQVGSLGSASLAMYQCTCRIGARQQLRDKHSKRVRSCAAGDREVVAL